MENKTVSKHIAFYIMRKMLLLLVLSPLSLLAQVQFGYYSHAKVLGEIPEYANAEKEYKLLKERCQNEVERNEQELTRAYVAYLDGQQDFPELILRKRQNELQQMVDNSILFRKEMRRWLAAAKDSLFYPCNQKIEKALERVCLRDSLAYAINTDEVKYSYVNPKSGADITALLIEEVLNPTERPKNPLVECAEDTSLDKAVELKDAEDEAGSEVIKDGTAVLDGDTDVTTDEGSIGAKDFTVATDSIAVATDSTAVKK